MTLCYVPLLAKQRALYDIPRGLSRFDAYLVLMLTENRDRVQLPALQYLNPMGKDHCAACLDAYLTDGAEQAVAATVAQLPQTLGTLDGDYRCALVLIDDLGGGWTNRWTTEFALRFDPAQSESRGWLIGALWTSDPGSAAVACSAMARAIWRMVYRRNYGVAVTLRQRLAQEGWVLAKTDTPLPILDAEEHDYTKHVLAPHLDTDHYPTVLAALFGDEAAVSLGYTPLGLSSWAGIALAHRLAVDALSQNQPLTAILGH